MNFLQRSLRTSRVIDPPEPLDLDSAILGVIFVYPTDGLPQRVTMEWDLWNERMQRVPVSAVDQAGGLPSTLEPDWRVLEWQNFLKQPELPTLTEITLPPGAMTRTLEVARWVMLPILAILAFTTARSLRREARPGLLPGATAAVALLTLLAFAWARGAQIDDRRAGAIVGGLLHNVYRAFDHRDEARIYDVLAHSVSGDLLADIYLEMRRGLELASQGGARAKVKNVEVIDIEATPAEGHAFVATTTWRVGGSVGHWGHLHQRKNQYRAELAVEPIDGVWKLVDLEILEEERI